MAPRTIKLYVKLLAASCVQIAIQFSYSLIFSLAGPLFGTRFRMPSTGVNVIFSVVGPLIGFFVQPIFGAIGDRCTFKFGRRRIFLVVGGIINVFGMILTALSTVFDDKYLEEGSVDETEFSSHIIGVVFGLSGLFISFFGINITQAPSRAIVSDIFDAENQQDANLMINAMCGLASIVCFAISAGTVGQEGTYLIMFAICAIVVVLATIPTVIFAKETRYVPEDGKKLNVLQPFLDLFGAIKMINKDIIFILLSLMFGWFAYQPLNTNLTNYVSIEVFGGEDNCKDAQDNGLRVALCILIVFAIIQFFSVIIFPFITETIGEVTTFVLFQGLAGISYIMIVIINYTFPKNIYCLDDINKNPDVESEPAYVSSLVLGFISVAFPAMAFVQTNSLPYSMLKKVVPEERYGAFVGLLNCAVVIAQFLASGLIALVQIMVDSYTVAIVVSVISAFLCCICSLVLYKVKTDKGSENKESERLIKDDIN